MELAAILHKLSDSLRDAGREMDRGNEDAAAETLEIAAREIRAELERKTSS